MLVSAYCLKETPPVSDQPFFSYVELYKQSPIDITKTIIIVMKFKKNIKKPFSFQLICD